MCGIIGIIGKEMVAPSLLEGLRRLEYRGYDSAGIATLVNGRIEGRRVEGKLDNLAKRLEEAPVQRGTGLGTPAGRRMACLPRPTPIRSPRTASPSSTMELSRISRR